jgi:hypothetical protein
LDLDELEEETQEAIEQALTLVERFGGDQNPDTSRPVFLWASHS